MNEPKSIHDQAEDIAAQRILALTYSDLADVRTVLEIAKNVLMLARSGGLAGYEYKIDRTLDTINAVLCRTYDPYDPERALGYDGANWFDDLDNDFDDLAA